MNKTTFKIHVKYLQTLEALQAENIIKDYLKLKEYKQIEVLTKWTNQLIA